MSKSEDVSLFKVVLSVMSAMIGIQSNKNRERDFAKGRPAAYIVVGIIMTVLFILTLWTVVSIILSNVGV